MSLLDWRIWEKKQGYKWLYLRKNDPKTYTGYAATREEAEAIIFTAK
jgi:hypothetical protein